MFSKLFAKQVKKLNPLEIFDMKTKFFVVEENVLGCINPCRPNVLNILHASILRGSTLSNVSWMFVPLDPNDMRPATRKDFEEFRVNSEGFEKDTKNYEFPAE